MDPPEPDEELVRRFLLGDTDAFERLVERHRQRVYNLCLRVLGDPEDAADAVQDTFLSVLTKLRQFRGDAAFTTWMHRVAVNACYDLSRKRRRQPLLRLAGDQDLP
ncbi:MAG TPA: sigma-70 family RNA polymerase sigma factor, partial [Actinomycetota bacterium]